MWLFSVDFETVGLYGPHFAAGWVVINAATGAIDFSYSGYAFYMPKEEQAATPRDWKWLQRECLPHLEKPPHPQARFHPNIAPERLLSLTSEAWSTAQQMGAVLLADCPFPVGARAWLEIMDPVPPEEKLRASPCPVIDLASVSFALFPPGEAPPDVRLEASEPLHHAFYDALVTARTFFQFLEIRRKRLELLGEWYHALSPGFETSEYMQTLRRDTARILGEGS